MAASGINEHHEACRKQHVINRQAFTKRQFVDKVLEADEDANQRSYRKSPAGHLGPLNSYHQELRNDATDRVRRKAVRQEQYLTYSAKLNGRLSSQDYVQQW